MSWFEEITRLCPRAEPLRGDAPGAKRRFALRSIAALVVVPALTGCGFHLRGQATYQFTSIYVNGAQAPLFANVLRQSLESGGSAKVVTSPADAQVVLDILPPVDEKDVLSLSGAGSVREYLLVSRISFRLHDAEGGEWLPPGEIAVRRTYTFNETEVLARDHEEQRLLKEMQQDAIAQLIRRLQAAHKPA